LLGLGLGGVERELESDGAREDLAGVRDRVFRRNVGHYVDCFRVLSHRPGQGESADRCRPIQARSNHAVAEATVFSKDLASRRERINLPCATSTFHA
jgi:hypothetical protein